MDGRQVADGEFLARQGMLRKTRGTSSVTYAGGLAEALLEAGGSLPAGDHRTQGRPPVDRRR